MRIKRLELKNFKRFTDLTISDIPETSKLVLLIGSNGSGKSSLFDAFDWLKKETLSMAEMPYTLWKKYYQKEEKQETQLLIDFYDAAKIEKKLYTKFDAESAKMFIGRSSIRIVPRISNTANLSQILTDGDRPASYIENDTRFINDVFLYIQEINTASRDILFGEKQTDPKKIFRDFIEPFNNSLLNIFGGDNTTTIQLIQLIDQTPTTTANLLFKKGESKINYDLLSHGEKQVVILLINFIVRKDFYNNAIIFIDEMDCHLNTALSYNLLDEIVTRWIPDSSQLWTASHALGFIDYAKDNEQASIIDFDLLNFDTKKELTPEPKDKMDVYEIAIPKETIAKILKGYKLVIVENKNDEHFNAALGQNGYLFLPANNNREVFLTVKADKSKLGLRDRDYLRTDETESIKAKHPNLKILSLYTFENYIYHPENIAELSFTGFNKEEYITEITKQKNEKLLEIVSEIGTSRTHYIEFKDCIKNDENIKPIREALASDNFDDFYPCFNMKKYYDKKYLHQFKYTLSDLSKTAWFKQQILKTIDS